MATQQLKPLTLRRNFSWTFVGNVVYAACQWGMLVVLAKLGSPEMVGQFTLGLAVTAPVIMFTNLQLRAVQATDVRGQYIFGDYLGLRLIATGLALLIFIVITVATGYDWQTSLVILLVGLAKAFESLSDVFYGLIQQHERMDRIALSLMIKGFLSLLLLGIGVYVSSSVVWGVVGLAFAWAVILVSYDLRSGALMLGIVPNRHQSEESGDVLATLRPRWHLRTLGKLIWLTLPLGFVMMLVSLNTSMPRYFIDQYLGKRELGIFAAIAYLMVAGKMVVSALAESASPRLAKYYAVGDGIAFRTLIFKLVGIGSLLGGTVILLAIVAGSKILTILYQPEYAQHADLFVWLMVAAAVDYVYTFLGHGMTAARYFRIQMPLLALVSTTSAIGCLLLIPSRGMQGAAIAMIVATLVGVGGSSGVVLHALHKLHNPLKEDKNYDIG